MSITTAERVQEAKARVETLDPDRTARQLADGALVVDIRESAERETSGAIPGAVHVPRGLLEFKADPTMSTHMAELDPVRRTILYCASGGRSALAVLTLQELGYTDVAHLDGGITAWLAAGRPVEFAE